MRRKKWWSTKEKQKLPYFEASSFACHSRFRICVWVWQEKKLKYRHRNLWNVTTWRLSREAGLFSSWLVRILNLQKQTHGSLRCIELWYHMYNIIILYHRYMVSHISTMISYFWNYGIRVKNHTTISYTRRLLLQVENIISCPILWYHRYSIS